MNLPVLQGALGQCREALDCLLQAPVATQQESTEAPQLLKRVAAADAAFLLRKRNRGAEMRERSL